MERTSRPSTRLCSGLCSLEVSLLLLACPLCGLSAILCWTETLNPGPLGGDTSLLPRLLLGRSQDTESLPEQGQVRAPRGWPWTGCWPGGASLKTGAHESAPVKALCREGSHLHTPEDMQTSWHGLSLPQGESLAVGSAPAAPRQENWTVRKVPLSLCLKVLNSLLGSTFHFNTQMVPPDPANEKSSHATKTDVIICFPTF
ncbi:hypothetical protein H1C71_018640 [Ictidomys tridecemlineatus]|nr:hypothetical protein H1C71_018640 [Ictidomys tridecemlineatus]